MTDDGVAWEGPQCPDCDHELDVEAIATTLDRLKVLYACPTDGIVSMDDLFPN